MKPIIKSILTSGYNHGVFSAKLVEYCFMKFKLREA